MIVTLPLWKIRTAILDEFGVEFDDGLLRNLGVYNRRKIAGSQTWSQHSWGNAWDIGVRSWSMDDGDRLVAWLRKERDSGQLPIGLILWRVKDHFDHIHVEGKPKWTGVPPEQGDEDMPYTPDELKEIVGEAVDERLAANLNIYDYKNKSGQTRTISGLVVNSVFHVDTYGTRFIDFLGNLKTKLGF
jgi:hypothetical protein